MATVLQLLRTRYKRYLLAASLLFILGTALGVYLAVAQPELIANAMALVFEHLEDLGRDIFDAPQPSGIMRLFTHNLRAFLLMAVLGLALGVYPAFGLLVNGVVIGVAAVLMHAQTGSLTVFLAGVLPHGVLEIPAIILGAALGLRLGLGPLFARHGERSWQGYRTELTDAAKVLLFGAALLFLAAIIEVSITPNIMALFI